MSVKQLAFAFIASLSLVSAAALADSGAHSPMPLPAPVDKDDLTIRCKFFGSGTGKDGSWALGCRAEAKIDKPKKEDDFLWKGNEDDTLRVTCGDGDNDLDDRVLFSGGALHGLAPSLDDPFRAVDLLITGVKTTAPLIRIDDFDGHRLVGDGDDDRDDRNVRRAVLTFIRHGVQFALPGVCEIRKEHKHMPPVSALN